MAEIKSHVVVEYRPMLGACNVFIKAKFEPESTVISVVRDTVCINSITSFSIIFPNISLAPKISGLNVSSKSMFFRLETTPTSILALNNLKEMNVDKYVPDVGVDEETTVCCRKCDKELATGPFSRVLPLPDNEDMSTFFCHRAPGGDVSLDPQPADLFYGSCFFKIHKSRLESPGDGVLFCDGCRNWLGVSQRNYIQLWNSTTTFSQSKKATVNEAAIHDFKRIVHQVNSHAPGILNKVVIHCQVDPPTEHFLLLWVLDPTLILLTSDTEPSTGTVTLNERRASKIIYSYHETKSPEVEEWISSCHVTHVPVSKAMLESALVYLTSWSSYFPSEYSTAFTMHISYVEHFPPSQ